MVEDLVISHCRYNSFVDSSFQKKLPTRAFCKLLSPGTVPVPGSVPATIVVGKLPRDWTTVVCHEWFSDDE
jgi:hypothetical protein